MLPRYKVFKRAANVFRAVDLDFPILLTCSGRSRVAVGDNLAERGWALPSGETFWSGRGWRASHAAWGGAPGVSLGCYNRPHTLHHSGHRERLGQVRQGRVARERTPSPTPLVPAVALRPGAPRSPAAQRGAGLRFTPPNLLPG